MQFNEILRELRAEKGLNQSKLAEALGLTQDSISLWENGKRLPDTQYVIRLADFFQVSADFLLGRSDDFGNVAAVPDAQLPADEQELLTLFRSFGEDYKRLALDTLRTWKGAASKKDATKRA